MSKYGFDPDEVIETKVDLIDKDGFHGAGEANGGGSSGGTLTEGLYLYHQHLNNWQTDPNGSICGTIILEVAKHQDIFEGSFNKQLPYGLGMMFYDETVDKNAFHISSDEIVYGEELSSVGPPGYGSLCQINEDYIVIPLWFKMSDRVYSDIHGVTENTFADYVNSPVCIALPFEVDAADANVPAVTKFIFIDTMFTINETQDLSKE